MSQTVTGEDGGGGGDTLHSSRKLLQHNAKTLHASGIAHQCHGGGSYNSCISPAPFQSNSQMETGFQSPGAMQFRMHSSHMNHQYQHAQQISAMKGRNDINIAPYSPQINHCGNPQYYHGANYITTVTVNPGERYRHQVPVQFSTQNTPNFYMNAGSAETGHVSKGDYYNNVMVIGNKSNAASIIGNQLAIDPSRNSTSGIQNTNIIPDANSNTFPAANNNNNNNNNNVADIASLHANAVASKTKKSNKNTNPNRYIDTSSESVCEVSVSEKFNDNSTVKNVSNSATSLRTCTSTSVSNSLNSLNRPRTSSRCDSARSETAESSCSSLSSESLPDQNHSSQQSLNIKNANSTGNQQLHFTGNPYLNNQIQAVNTFNNRNISYQNYLACHGRMNQVVGKPGVYGNGNVLQSFQQVNSVQHVQVQSGQVQIMKQQYQCLQGPGLVHPSVGVSPSNIMPHAQSGSTIQGQNMTNMAVVADSNSLHGQSGPLISNCMSQNGAIPQNFCGTQPHGHLPHQVLHNNPAMPAALSQQGMGNSGCVMGPSSPSHGKPFSGIVVVPFGWKRLNVSGQIVYVSPSGSELRSPVEVCEYLMQENTCKCGLQCPLRVENTFSFDPKVPHRLTMPNELSSGEATKMCNHRRKLALAFSHHLQKHAKKEDGRKKRKRKSSDMTDTSESSISADAYQQITDAVLGNYQMQQIPDFEQHAKLQQQQLQQQQQHPAFHLEQKLIDDQSSPQCFIPADTETNFNQPSEVDTSAEQETYQTLMHHSDTRSEVLQEQKYHNEPELLKQNLESDSEKCSSQSETSQPPSVQTQQPHMQLESPAVFSQVPDYHLDTSYNQQRPHVKKEEEPLLAKSETIQTFKEESQNITQVCDQSSAQTHCLAEPALNNASVMSPVHQTSPVADSQSSSSVPSVGALSTRDQEGIELGCHIHKSETHHMSDNSVELQTKDSQSCVQQCVQTDHHVPQHMNSTEEDTNNQHHMHHHSQPSQMQEHPNIQCHVQQQFHTQHELQQPLSQTAHDSHATQSQMHRQDHQPMQMQQSQTPDVVMQCQSNTPETVVLQNQPHTPEVSFQRQSDTPDVILQSQTVVQPQNYQQYLQIQQLQQQYQIPKSHLQNPLHASQGDIKQQSQSPEVQLQQQTCRQQNQMQQQLHNQQTFIHQQCQAPHMQMLHNVNTSRSQMQHQSHSPRNIQQTHLPQPHMQLQPHISQPHMQQVSQLQQNSHGLPQPHMLQRPPTPQSMQQQLYHPQAQMHQQCRTPETQLPLHSNSSQTQLQQQLPCHTFQPHMRAFIPSQQSDYMKQQQVQHFQTPVNPASMQNAQNLIHHEGPAHQMSVLQQTPNHQFPAHQPSQHQNSYQQSQVHMPNMQQMAPMQHQQMYQQNQNQNWHPMYGPSRMLVPNNGCQTNPEGFASAIQTHGPGTQVPCQHPQGCEMHNNPCFPGHQNAQLTHHIIRPPPFTNMNRSFCRGPGEAVFRGMVPSQGGCLPQQAMPMQPPHPVIAGMPPNPPFINNNPMCRIPVHSGYLHVYGNGSGVAPQDPEGKAAMLETPAAPKIPIPEEGEKRRKSGGGRARKRVKPSIEQSSVTCPTVDSRNLRTENAVSPHTGPGPPFTSAHNPNSQCIDTKVVNSCNSAIQHSQGMPVSGPSFMEDPNGYLAQQTALLNSTMSGGAVGQFSPQAPRVSPRPSCPSSQASAVGSPNVKGYAPRTPVTTNPRTSVPSPAIVPLPSNVPLPARVNKATLNTSVMSSCTSSCSASTAAVTACSSVQSKSCHSASHAVPSPSESQISCYEENSTFGTSKDNKVTLVATAESSCLSHTVTVTYTNSSVTTTTCGSESNSPQSSQDVLNTSLEIKGEGTQGMCEIVRDAAHEVDNRRNKTGNTSVKLSLSKTKVESQRKNSDGCTVPDYINCSSNGRSSSSSCLSIEAANKPLTPGPVESTENTQSPLEMVQNIVSSIPLPASSDEFSPLPPGRHIQHSQHVTADQMPSVHQALTQQIVGPQVYNMSGAANGMTGVMYNTNGAGMIRGTGPLVVHGATSSGSIPQGVIVSNSGNMVVVTSPFTSKVSVTTPVVCTNVTGINPVMGVQTVPQVQVQTSLGSVQSHQLQPVQPVVQLVNTFATMQTPVIIQNGSNIIQSPSGMLSSHGSVIGPASIIPNPAFVTNQPLLAVDSSGHSSSQVQVTQVVTSSSGEGTEDNGGGSNRVTPTATSVSNPTTPHSTPCSSHGMETPPSGGSGGSGKKRKRKRNTSTPQGVLQQMQHTTQPPNIMPTIIMGKQIPQHMVMNGTQLSQVSPYGNVAGAQVAAVTTVGTGSGPTQAAGQPANSINVVQMVSGHVPMHLQHSSTIIVPSAATPGLIINQLPDGTFISTDPNSGVTYPVQLQISGSHIVGVTPLPSASSTSNVIGSLSNPSATQGTVVALRQPTSQTSSVINASTKLLNIPPSMTSAQGNALLHNAYGVSTNPSGAQSVVCPTTANLAAAFPANSSLHQPLMQKSAAAIQQPLLVGNGNAATLLQQKTTTIVARQTTVLATQGALMGTHSSVSTQTPGMLGESDVTSSDSVANTSCLRELPISPSHQSAEVTTTKQDEDSVSTPEPLLLTPPQTLSPEAYSKKPAHSVTVASSRPFSGNRQEPHSASTPEDAILNETSSVVWGQHRGHQFWPAQVLHQVGCKSVVIRWFGDHQRETVSVASLTDFPDSAQSARRRSRGQTALDEAIAEANEVCSPSYINESSELCSTSQSISPISGGTLIAVSSAAEARVSAKYPSNLYPVEIPPSCTRHRSGARSKRKWKAR